MILQTGHSVEIFPHLRQVVFALRAYLSSQEGILGRCCRSLLALQDGEVTIITQTIEDKMSLAKLRRFIRAILFAVLKVSDRAETETEVKLFRSQKVQ